ncbi:amidase [Arthrobacter sp. JSM 101049]|uniref:amidase n=1 Tax=Arthrobacter sp. JSM 101049 TaxID=929097 RepID=UPI0035627A68
MDENRTLMDIAEGFGIDGTGRTSLWQDRLDADRQSVQRVRTAITDGVPQGLNAATMHGLPAELPPSRHNWDRAGGEFISDRVERHLEAIAANAGLNAFTHVFAQESREAARELDRRLARGEDPGPLTGALVAVKDIMRIDGWASSGGTKAFHMQAGAEATAVARLRAAGAIIIGAANLHALAYGPFSTSSDFGAVGNPLNPRLVAGGSSGGSAAAVAAGLADVAIGTDTAGSIRMPAALCGVVGVKPTYGSVPSDGCHPLARTLDHIGPLARSVNDARIILDVISDATRRSGRDAATTRRQAAPSPRRPRIGIPWGYIDQLLDPQVRKAFERSIGHLDKWGAEVVPVTIPQLDDGPSIMLCTLGAEAFGTFRKLLSGRASQIPEDVRLRLEAGMFISAADYIYAQELRENLGRGVDSALEGVDVLATPTLPITAPGVGEIDDVVPATGVPVRAAMNRMALPFNLTGHPALSLPIATDRGGAGIGIQFIGRRGADSELLSIALQLEEQISNDAPAAPDLRVHWSSS